VAIHHAAGLQPSFEISRSAPGALSYLVAFDEHAPLVLGADRSVVVAEIELDSPAGRRIGVDPRLTMLTDRAGVLKATVAAGTLEIDDSAITFFLQTPQEKSR
jgi:hypothetical protein